MGERPGQMVGVNLRPRLCKGPVSSVSESKVFQDILQVFYSDMDFQRFSSNESKENL